MTVLVSEVTKKASNFQDQVDVANTAMKNMNLPKDAQELVRTYLITTQGTQHEQKQLENFISLISPSLREQVAVNIFAKVAWTHHRFRNVARDLAKLQLKQQKMQPTRLDTLAKTYIDLIVSNMSTKLSEPDSVIIEQFQEGEAMYLIAKGECMVIVGEESEDRFYKSNTTEEIDQNTMLRSGQYFGEISLVYGCKCTAKVVAKKYCTLAQLTKDKFRDVTTRIPQLLETIH